jgi:bifunctional non-homologous end joining protein LigD
MNKIPFRVAPMLATLVDEPFCKDHWVFEEKYDGVRMLAYKEGAKVSLISRNGVDRTTRYASIAAEIEKLRTTTLLLDGEIVVFDAKKVSHFQLLQQGKGDPRYAVFDCLYKDGRDLRRKPLSERREALEAAVKSGPVVQIAARLSDDGIAAVATARKRGLEGIIGKDSRASYSEGRSKAWLKVKINLEEEFVIGGFTKPEGSRHHFGALLLGSFHKRELQYVGKVGTGFNEKILTSLHRQLLRLERAKSPFASEVPREKRDICFTKTSGANCLHGTHEGRKAEAPGVSRTSRRQRSAGCPAIERVEQKKPARPRQAGFPIPKRCFGKTKGLRSPISPSFIGRSSPSFVLT